MTTAPTAIAALAGIVAALAAGEAWHALGAPATPPEATRPARRRLRAPRRRAPHPAVPPAAIGGLLGYAGAGLLGVPAGVIGGLLVARALRRAHARRALRASERAVGSFARSTADAIRGGQSLRGALALSAEDLSVPAALRARLRRSAAAMQRGAPTAHVLEELARGGGPQLTLLVAIVALHAEHGGRLAVALERLAGDADHAATLDDERATATAQARATVRTVAALPLIALVGAQALGGDLLGSVAAHPAALALLLLGLGLELIAVLIAQRLVEAAT